MPVENNGPKPPIRETHVVPQDDHGAGGSDAVDTQATSHVGGTSGPEDKMVSARDAEIDARLARLEGVNEGRSQVDPRKEIKDKVGFFQKHRGLGIAAVAALGLAIAVLGGKFFGTFDHVFDQFDNRQQIEQPADHMPTGPPDEPGLVPIAPGDDLPDPAAPGLPDMREEEPGGVLPANPGGGLPDGDGVQLPTLDRDAIRNPDVERVPVPLTDGQTQGAPIINTTPPGLQGGTGLPDLKDEVVVPQPVGRSTVDAADGTIDTAAGTNLLTEGAPTDVLQVRVLIVDGFQARRVADDIARSPLAGELTIELGSELVIEGQRQALAQLKETNPRVSGFEEIRD